MYRTLPARQRTPDVQSLARPPIDHVPGHGPQPAVLPAFLATGIHRWGGEPTRLPPRVIGALWTLLGLTMALSGWLIGVRNGVAECSGFACEVISLGSHHELVLTLALVCAGALAVTLPLAKGIAEVSGPQLGVVVVGILCGIVSLSGLLALLVGCAALLAIAVVVVMTAVDRF